MELRQYAAIVWKWLWLIVLTTLVAAVSSYLATGDQPLTYRVKTTLMVGQVLQKRNPSGADFFLAEDLARTYSEVARRHPVRQATMDALGVSWLPGYTVRSVPNTQLIEIQVIDTSPNCIFVKDRDGKYILANEAVAGLYGVSLDKIVGMNITAAIEAATVEQNLTKRVEMYQEIQTKFDSALVYCYLLREDNYMFYRWNIVGAYVSPIQIYWMTPLTWVH